MWYKEILCYPRYSDEEFKSRKQELAELGIEDLIEDGNTIIFGKRILGKGTTSLVVKALYHGFFVALKIRRTDSNRESVENEALILKMLNDTGISPKIFAYSKNFIVMELIRGINLDDFILRASNEEIKPVLVKLLLSCILLDKMGIDHGDLTNASDHVVVYDKNIRIIDFESASTKRKPQNLTSIISYLFLSNRSFSQKLYGIINKQEDELILLLRKYKKGE